MATFIRDIRDPRFIAAGDPDVPCKEDFFSLDEDFILDDDPGWVCTLMMSHDGPHVAHGWGGRILAIEGVEFSLEAVEAFLAI